MLYAGEDPRFIARRLVISASEDVGNADPQALLVAVAAQQALEFLGLPEGRIPLGPGHGLLACAPKSNAAYIGLEKATEDVKNGNPKGSPCHLKDAHYPGVQALGQGTATNMPMISGSFRQPSILSRSWGPITFPPTWITRPRSRPGWSI